jgi:hypothetical protein
MLELAEKIAAGVCIAMVALTAGVYAFFKLPSPQTIAALPAVREEIVPIVPPSTTPGKTTTPITQPPPEIKKVLDNLGKQGQRASMTTLIRKRRTIPQPLYQVLSAEANLMPVLKRYKSRVIATPNGNTRLQVLGVDKNSPLGKLGFENNDIFELVNGEILDFDPSESTTYYDLWNSAKRDLEAGKPITITVTRSGRLEHVEFLLDG